MTTEGAVAVAVVEYLEARDSGRPLDTGAWLNRHPAVADELRAFLDETDGLTVRLRAFRGTAREPDLATDEKFVGDYELLEKVGGNMGVVYRARQVNLPLAVAVKLLLRSGHSERFRAEAEAMARLQHPHIVRIVNVSREDGVPFFSMEWCPGGTLAARVAEYRHRPDAAAELLEQIAGAVHFAHRRGLLHLDLKPANILFDEFGQPRVADFGLAVFVHSEPGEDRAGAGTPAYMAPEQLTGEVTVATDVYGLGAVLYELLTGRPPHPADTLTATLGHVRTGDVIPPVEIDPGIDPDLDAICRKCLAKEPTERYATAADVAADLHRFRNGLPSRARPLGPLGRLAHAIRQARAAGEFRTLAPGLLAQAGFVLASNATAFALLRAGAAEVWVWVAVLASYVPLFALLARERFASRGRYNPVRAHLWAIWTGHAVACVAVFVGHRFAAGDDFARGICHGYVACAGLNALAFVVFGSVLTGRLYLLGLAWAVATVGMGLFLSWAPLIYALLMAVCSLVTGLHLRALERQSA
jgi:serine/threonine-protein kinase